MSDRSIELSREAAQARKARILEWTREGSADLKPENRDTAVWEDEVWWGYWRQVGGEDVYPPNALFRTEEEAHAHVLLVGEIHDWHVGPVVLRIEARDNYEVPS